MGIVGIAGGAALGSLCVDGVFGGKLPGSHRCDFCEDWLCARHYADHMNAGPHGYHHDDTACSDIGMLNSTDVRSMSSGSR